MGDSYLRMNLWRLGSLWVIPNDPTLDLRGEVSVSWVWIVPTLALLVFCSSANPKRMMTGYWTSLSSNTGHETGAGVS